MPAECIMTHHAYLYEGSLAELPVLVESARKLFSFKKEHDPDVQVREFEKFGIDDAHSLQSLASFRSVSGKALFVIGIGGITIEAQQSLLKLFEEPQAGATFVVLTPHGVLIPTLRSRMLPFPGKVEAAVPSSKEAKQFLAANGKERSAYVAELLKEEEGARERVRDFLNALETALYPKLSSLPQARAGLEDIAKVRSYVSDRSPSLKMLLEHLATSLPQI